MLILLRQCAFRELKGGRQSSQESEDEAVAVSFEASDVGSPGLKSRWELLVEGAVLLAHGYVHRPNRGRVAFIEYVLASLRRQTDRHARTLCGPLACSGLKIPVEALSED